MTRLMGADLALIPREYDRAAQLELPGGVTAQMLAIATLFAAMGLEYVREQALARNRALIAEMRQTGIDAAGQGSGSLQVTFHELVPNEPIKPSELGRV